MAMVLALTLALVLAACGNAGGGQGSEGGGEGGGGNPDGPKVTIGSKNFTEQFILAELYAQALGAKGFNVEKKLNLGSEQIADRALQSGQIDMYPEYTGTALVSTLKDKEPAPKTPEATYDRAKELYAQRDPANTMLPPADFNNSYGIVVVKEVAEKEGLKTMEDLAKASPNLTFATYSEFESREDGFPNMKKNYPAFDFKDKRVVDQLGLRYKALETGEAQVGVGFLTDGQIASQELAVMEEPKSIWPFYYPAPVFRSEVLEKNPEIEEITNSVSESLDLTTMQELNAAVDIQKEDAADVAKQHLEEKGLLAK